MNAKDLKEKILSDLRKVKELSLVTEIIGKLTIEYEVHFKVLDEALSTMENNKHWYVRYENNFSLKKGLSLTVIAK